jgi:hypothetical protein
MKRDIIPKHETERSYGKTRLREEYAANRSSEAMDEKTFFIFQPDILAASQYFQHTRSTIALEPEKKLMLAVLRDAVECFQTYLFSGRAKGKAIFQHAEEWIMDKDHDWLFSFESICEFLDLNPDYIRNGLIEWKRHALSVSGRAQIYDLSDHRNKRPTVHTKERKTRALKVAGI